VRSIFSMSAYNLVFGTEIRFKVNGVHLKVKTVTSTVSLKKLDVSIVESRFSARFPSSSLFSFCYKLRND